MPGADERVVELSGKGLGEGTQQVLQLAEQLGYVVATAGPGSYRLARSRRRLIGKQTESVVVSVYDDRGGTKARFVGPVDAALLQHLTNGVQPSANGQPPSRGSTPRVLAASPDLGERGPTERAPAPSGHSMPTPIERPAPQATVAPTGGMISAVPSGATHDPLPPPTAAAAPVTTGDTADVDEYTIMKVHRETLAPPSTVPGLRLPGGRFVPLTAPVVIGRDPDPACGAPGALAVPVAEPSLSKTHLVVSIGAGGLRVTDLHSSNGTIIDVTGSRTPCVPGTEVIVPPGAAIIAGALFIEVVGP